MEAKQEVIINVAESQFIRFGFRKTTMEDIAKAAGIGKATLYYYFKSKEDIFAAMAEKIAHTIIQSISDTVQAARTPQEKLDILAMSLARFMKGKIDYYATLREEILEIFPAIRRKQETAEKHVLNTVREILQEGVNQRVFAIADVPATARLILLLLQALTERIIIEENLATWEDDMHLFLDTIVKGLEIRD